MCFFFLARTGISTSHQSRSRWIIPHHAPSTPLHHHQPPYISPDNEAGISARDTIRSCAPMSHSDCAFPFSCPPVSPLRQMDITVSPKAPVSFPHPTRTPRTLRLMQQEQKIQIPVFVSVSETRLVLNPTSRLTDSRPRSCFTQTADDLPSPLHIVISPILRRAECRHLRSRSMPYLANPSSRHDERKKTLQP